MGEERNGQESPNHEWQRKKGLYPPIGSRWIVRHISHINRPPPPPFILSPLSFAPPFPFHERMPILFSRLPYSKSSILFFFFKSSLIAPRVILLPLFGLLLGGGETLLPHLLVFGPLSPPLRKYPVPAPGGEPVEDRQKGCPNFPTFPCSAFLWVPHFV